MAIKLDFVVRHTSSPKIKQLSNGNECTHDWQISIGGCDDTDIRNIIEQVIFNLHATFKNPKRSKYF